MKIEIIAGAADNPVAEFFSSPSSTPETDAIAERLIPMAENITASNAQYIIKQVLTEILIKTSELERERDEAREDTEHWKIEYEIVEDRLRGKKHQRDNGIISDEEIIPKLTSERNEAREKGERYRIEANSLMLQRDEAITRRMETIMQCELYEQERDKAREAFVIATDQMQCKTRELLRERDEAREEMKDMACQLVQAEARAGRFCQERDEIATENMLQVNKLCNQRDEALESLRILAGLVAYGLGQSGEEWSLEAMRQATTAIQNAKSLEAAK